jgi:hypothetical protein
MKNKLYNFDPQADADDLSQAREFRGANLDNRDLSKRSLRETSFARALLRSANLADSDLTGCDFSDADLSNANLRGATLEKCLFLNANLSGANLFKSDLNGAVMVGCNMFRTNLREASIGQTTIADSDLGTCTGLESIQHTCASAVSVDCLYRSLGPLPQSFLKGVGFPPIFIDFLPSLLQAERGIEFHSCFISYSHRDEVFARRLWSTLRSRDIRVWYAPEDLRGGQKLIDQIDSAIQMHDKILIVLSEASIASSWVETEVRRAKKHEDADCVRKLFPIRMCDMGVLKSWSCFDSDSGRDLAREIREYYMPDFSEWNNAVSFERECNRLCEDLKTSGVRMSWRPESRKY